MRHIRVYFDFSCPYCYNEYFFLKEVRKQAEVAVEYYGCEIHPDTPVEGKLIDFPGFEKSMAALNRLGEPLQLRAGDMKHSFNTNKALQLLEEAIAQGKAEAYVEKVFRTYFEEQKNVGQDEVILGIAKEVGIEGAEAVLAENRYKERIEEHNQHTIDLKLEYVPTITDLDDNIIMAGVLTLEDLQKEFLG